jgi:hypothetical protein
MVGGRMVCAASVRPRKALEERILDRWNDVCDRGGSRTFPTWWEQ